MFKPKGIRTCTNDFLLSNKKGIETETFADIVGVPCRQEVNDPRLTCDPLT